MADLKYSSAIYRAVEGGYVAEIPALNGCIAQVETLDETLSELEIVEGLWLQTAKESGLKIPLIEIEIERVKEKLAA